MRILSGVMIYLQKRILLDFVHKAGGIFQMEFYRIWKNYVQNLEKLKIVHKVGFIFLMENYKNYKIYVQKL